MKTKKKIPEEHFTSVWIKIVFVKEITMAGILSTVDAQKEASVKALVSLNN